MLAQTCVIEVDNLVKDYPGVRAVDGVSFSVSAGEIFGLLGPNGAGKTTILNVLQGLRKATSGQVSVFGLDINKDTNTIKRRIGVQLQRTSLLPDLNALEQVELFTRLYGYPFNRAKALDLLQRVALVDKAKALPNQMSGGQQQRLALALALVNDPEIVFLDEPTAGLDPQARHALWDLIRTLREDERTVVLTTHYMEEAETLCHRVGILDHGKLLALDTPGGLINQLGGLSSITTAAPLPIEQVRLLPGVRTAQLEGNLRRIQTDNVSVTSGALLELARQQDVMLHDLHVRQPNLEDVFLHMTGRTLRDM